MEPEDEEPTYSIGWDDEPLEGDLIDELEGKPAEPYIEPEETRLQGDIAYPDMPKGDIPPNYDSDENH